MVIEYEWSEGRVKSAHARFAALCRKTKTAGCTQLKRITFAMDRNEPPARERLENRWQLAVRGAQIDEHAARAAVAALIGEATKGALQRPYLEIEHAMPLSGGFVTHLRFTNFDRVAWLYDKLRKHATVASVKEEGSFPVPPYVVSIARIETK